MLYGGLTCVPQKDMLTSRPPEPVSVTLLRARFLWIQQIMALRMRRSFQETGRGVWRHGDVRRGRVRMGWSGACGHKPRMLSRRQLEDAGADAPSEPPEGPAPHSPVPQPPGLGLLASSAVRQSSSVTLHPSRLWYSVTTATGNYRPPLQPGCGHMAKLHPDFGSVASLRGAARCPQHEGWGARAQSSGYWGDSRHLGLRYGIFKASAFHGIWDLAPAA